MRELNYNECQVTCGGVFLAVFSGGFLSGALRGNFNTTLGCSALFGALAYGAVGSTFGPLGALVAAPVGAAIETVAGYLGYTVGHYFAGPPTTVVTVPANTTVIVS